MTKTEFKKRLHEITDVSHIRIQKLLRMIQGAILYFILGFLISHLIDDTIIPDYTPDEDIKTTILLAIIQMALIVIGTFYIKKIANLVPFPFKYTSSFDIHRGDLGMGGTIGLGLIYIHSQKNFMSRLKVIEKIVNKYFE